MQALKGEAVASITFVPVICGKYYVGTNILIKQYDRSASLADIHINEIEAIMRVHNTLKSLVAPYIPSTNHTESKREYRLTRTKYGAAWTSQSSPNP